MYEERYSTRSEPLICIVHYHKLTPVSMHSTMDNNKQRKKRRDKVVIRHAIIAKLTYRAGSKLINSTPSLAGMQINKILFLSNNSLASSVLR